MGNMGRYTLCIGFGGHLADSCMELDKTDHWNRFHVYGVSDHMNFFTYTHPFLFSDSVPAI